jgi:hypothetical protein
MLISEENRRALQMMKLTTGLCESNEKMRLALIEARQFINDFGPEKPGSAALGTNDMLAEIDAALKS